MNFITLALFVVGFVLLVFGAELLVRGASKLAVAVGISPLVVGLTVVAFGTSAPELAVSIFSASSGAADIAIGNVVGSNIANVLLILGLSAAIAPLVVAQQLIRLEIPLMIGLSGLVWVMGRDGRLSWLDGLILASGAVAYTVFAIYQSRKESRAIQEEYTQEFGETAAKTPTKIVQQLGLIVVGLALLLLGANWLVNGAVTIAEYFGVSQLVIGLTVVAVGTSLPELATSVVASMRGERDIAVGNIVGSNIFNILTVLGLSAFVSPNGVAVSAAALQFDIPVMIAVAVACLPIFFTGHMIARWEGLVFFGYYILYTLYLILNAADYQALPTFNWITLLFVIPLTVLALVVSVIQSVRSPTPANS
ncbi:MAG: calcium/sodium antiporter [Anaerolineae bacterium]|nr:calcium/sodium antiporter [Anaerolineae bacterium]